MAGQGIDGGEIRKGKEMKKEREHMNRGKGVAIGVATGMANREAAIGVASREAAIGAASREAWMERRAAKEGAGEGGRMQ